MQWNPETKSWDFDLEESNVIWLQNNIVNQNFSVDPKFSEFYEKIAEVLDQLDSHVPCLALTDDQFTFKNVHHTVPQLKTTDIKEALVVARLYGITTWDENVEKNDKKSEFFASF